MQPTSLVVGIAGGSSSGKTTVTRAIVNALGPTNVALMEHDAYYKDLSMFGGVPAESINFDHPNAYDTELFVEHVLALQKGTPVQQPAYDYKTYKRSGKLVTVSPRELVIVEGILILADKAIRDIIDIKIYVDTDDDERLLRRIQRDTLERGREVSTVIGQYVQSVKPMHLEFVEPSKRWADVIIPRGGENTIAIEMVVARLKSLVVA